VREFWVADQICTKCGNSAVSPIARPGRFTRFLHMAIQIPEGVLLAECRRCHHLFLTPSAALLADLRQAYLGSLRERTRQTLESLDGILSGRKLEELLGLSQGYLCRVKNGHGQPSAVLCALLHLLEREPRLLSVLAEYWSVTIQPR
jgi:hypothetical protein